MLAGAARRLKGGIDSGRDPFAVLVDCQDHVLTTARAWVDLVVLEAFADAVGAARTRRCGPCSTASAACTPCTASRPSAAGIQEHGRLTPTRSKAVVKLVNTLCGEVREHAGLLVDAFAVPAPALDDARPVAAAA